MARGGPSLLVAFICTKALLPVRAPLTVAITPPIARYSLSLTSSNVQFHLISILLGSMCRAFNLMKQCIWTGMNRIPGPCHSIYMIKASSMLSWVLGLEPVVWLSTKQVFSNLPASQMQTSIMSLQGGLPHNLHLHWETSCSVRCAANTCLTQSSNEASEASASPFQQESHSLWPSDSLPLIQPCWLRVHLFCCCS